MYKFQIAAIVLYTICIVIGWLYGLNSSYQQLYPAIEPHIQRNHYEKFDAFLFKCFAYGVIGTEGSVKGLAIGLLSPFLIPAYVGYSVMQ